ncbi:MAG: DNA adenine methylase [Pyrinomonadaceae bacterium]
MKTNSPLRYPGGKASLTDLIRSIRDLNGLNGTDVAEPFAGGAGASLSLLYSAETRQIWLNDADPAIFDFWWSLIHRSDEFVRKLNDTPVTVDEWNRQRQTYLSKKKVSRLERGFSAFFLNRCNRSGVIINGGPIGGYEQAGDWKIDVRFNKNALVERCEKVAEYKGRIEVSNQDGIDFIQDLDLDQVTLFIDPPYYSKGKLLYLNLLTKDYHERLAKLLRSMQDESWILSYDDCPEIRQLYDQWANVRPFSLRYTAAQKRSGHELLITPKWLALPTVQESGSIVW